MYHPRVLAGNLRGSRRFARRGGPRLGHLCSAWSSCLRGMAEISNGLLRDSFLKVGIHATEGTSLFLLLAHSFECIIGKSAIVGMIVLNCYPNFTCILFKSTLGSEGLIRCKWCHELNILKPGGMFNENCGCVVAIGGGFSFDLTKKSQLGWRSFDQPTRICQVWWWRKYGEYLFCFAMAPLSWCRKCTLRTWVGGPL